MKKIRSGTDRGCRRFRGRRTCPRALSLRKGSCASAPGWDHHDVPLDGCDAQRGFVMRRIIRSTHCLEIRKKICSTSAAISGMMIRRTRICPRCLEILRGFPPMLMQVGSYEVLLDDTREAAKKARAEGVKSAVPSTTACSTSSRWDST